MTTSRRISRAVPIAIALAVILGAPLTTAGDALAKPVNLAKGKPTTQSSTAYSGAAKRAVDGNTNGRYGGNSVTHTRGAGADWWQVDLKAVYKIDTITVFNRTDSCCTKRLNNAIVLISPAPFKGDPLKAKSGDGIKRIKLGTVAAKKSVKVAFNGRYVRVQHAKKGVISLAEVQVMGENKPLKAKPVAKKKPIPPKPPKGLSKGAVNLAKGRKTKQSSTYDNAHNGDQAVDGDTVGGQWAQGSNFSTGGGKDQWFEVDLGSTYMIDAIEIYSHHDRGWDKIDKAWLMLADKPFKGTPLKAKKGDGITRFNLGKAAKVMGGRVGKVARYVRVQLQDPKKPLHFAEIAIWGVSKPVKPAPPPKPAVAAKVPDNVDNHALGKKASQSSFYNPAAKAGRAVDGNTNGRWAGKSVIHTADEKHPWWEVDLGKSQQIDFIRIYNRTEGSESRLDNAVIMISDKALGKLPLAGRQGDKVTRYKLGKAKAVNAIKVGRKGRYVRIQLPGDKAMHFAEVQVLGLYKTAPKPKTAVAAKVPDNVVNHALGKKAAQSSFYDPAARAGRAVDGNANGKWAGKSMIHTADEKHPWWEVDLGKSQQIDFVRIYNRTEGRKSESRLDNAVIMISDKTLGKLPLAGRQGDKVTRYKLGKAKAVNAIKVGRKGRFVRIQLPGDKAMHFAEVQVLGLVKTAPAPKPAVAAKVPDNVVNHAPGKKASQSSSWGKDHAAARAVDGTTDGNWSKTKLQSTGGAKHEWWEIDLGTSQQIDFIRIHNRTDCCGERLDNAVVMISDKPLGKMPIYGTPGDKVTRFKLGKAKAVNAIKVGRKGRYVRVQLPGKHQLHMAEVEVLGLVKAAPPPKPAAAAKVPAHVVNHALGKMAAQSSIYNPAINAGRAVDGNTDGKWAGKSVIHTANEKHPWWEVDLGKSQQIDFIRIYNRTDCCGEHLDNAVIMISDKALDKLPIYGKPGDKVTRLKLGKAQAVNAIKVGLKGRFVRIQSPGDKALHFAEVQVLAGTAPPPKPAAAANVPGNVVNLAQARKAQQSSIHNPGKAARAVDGNTAGKWTDKSVIHTKEENEPWWEVDLGKSQQIDFIRIHNRTDCCGERLDDAVIMISDKALGDMPIAGKPGDKVARFKLGKAKAVNAIKVGVKGRYVRIQSPGKAALNFAEVQVLGLLKIAAPPKPAVAAKVPDDVINLTTMKKAQQSSTHDPGKAERAIDGKTNGKWSDSSVIHTKKENEPWWEVDLGTSQQIDFIRIHNRTDCCEERLDDAVIMISDKALGDMPLAGKPGDKVTRFKLGKAKPVNAIKIGVKGRYVRIQSPGNTTLNFAEVEVLGALKPYLKVLPKAAAEEQQQLFRWLTAWVSYQLTPFCTPMTVSRNPEKPTTCAGGKVMKDGACYKRCPAGHERQGQFCVQSCPGGMRGTLDPETSLGYCVGEARPYTASLRSFNSKAACLKVFKTDGCETLPRIAPNKFVPKCREGYARAPLPAGLNAIVQQIADIRKNGNVLQAMTVAQRRQFGTATENLIKLRSRCEPQYHGSKCPNGMLPQLVPKATIGIPQVKGEAAIAPACRRKVSRDEGASYDYACQAGQVYDSNSKICYDNKACDDGLIGIGGVCVQFCPREFELTCQIYGTFGCARKGGQCQDVRPGKTESAAAVRKKRLKVFGEQLKPLLPEGIAMLFLMPGLGNVAAATHGKSKAQGAKNLAALSDLFVRSAFSVDVEVHIFPKLLEAIPKNAQTILKRKISNTKQREFVLKRYAAHILAAIIYQGAAHDNVMPVLKRGLAADREALAAVAGGFMDPKCWIDQEFPARLTNLLRQAQ